jgi:hypothetical protein
MIRPMNTARHWLGAVFFCVDADEAAKPFHAGIERTIPAWRRRGNIPIGVTRAIVAKFPVNSMAEVIYDPEHHRKSVLLAGPNKYTYYPLLAAPA